MRSVALLLLFAVSGMAFAQESGREKHWSLGTGFEGRLQEDINPQLPDTQVLPHVFAQYRIWPFGVSVEADWSERDSNSGALSIETRTLNLGLWGRYEFREPLKWSPFAGAGFGMGFDRVTSRFLEESDVRQGRRGFFGMGGGLTHSPLKHLLLEAEVRAALIQDRKDIALSGIFRLGFVL